MPAFMKLGDIKGESGDARFPGWFQIESFSFARVPGAGNVASSEPSAIKVFQSDIVVTLRHSPGSALIQEAAMNSTFFPVVLIVSDPAGTFELKDVFISGYSISGGGGGGLPMESVTFSCSSVTFEHRIQFPATPAGPLPKGKPAGRRR